MERDEIQEIKDGFQKFYLSRSLSFMRVGIALALTSFIIFGVIDVSDKQMYIRYLIICPALLITFTLTFSNMFNNYSQQILMIAYIVVCVALIFMIYLMPLQQEARELYVAGLALCMVGSSAIRIRSKWVIPCSSLILLCFAWVCRENSHDLLIHFPILVLVSAYSCFSIYSFEKTLKDTYTSFWLLDNERKNLLNVKERLASADSLICKLQQHITSKHSF
jgi:hypothetical protein